jgi:hypothetical protein
MMCFLYSVSFFKKALIMAKILKFKEGTASPPDNLITRKPWEFRSAGWESGHFIQMLKSQSAKLEKHRKEVFERGTRVSQLPPHFVLRGSMAYTIQGVYSYRTNEAKMREVYYLAGLIDCMINRVTPLLRHRIIGSHHGGAVVSCLFRHPGIVFRKDHLKGTVAQHVLDPPDVFPLGKTDGGKGVPGLHHGPAFNPGLFKCRFPDDLPQMVRAQGFPVKIQEHTAGLSTGLFPLVDQCLHGRG